MKNYRRFLTDIRDACTIYKRITNSRDYEGSFLKVTPSQLSEVINDDSVVNDLFIINEWRTGGAQGNCYDNSMSAIDADPKPIFDSLYSILERINPNLTFIQFTHRINPLVKHGERHEYGYYESVENFSLEIINLKELWDVLSTL